jgi:hypothetical protein
MAKRKRTNNDLQSITHIAKDLNKTDEIMFWFKCYNFVFTYFDHFSILEDICKCNTIVSGIRRGHPGKPFTLPGLVQARLNYFYGPKKSHLIEMMWLCKYCPHVCIMPIPTDKLFVILLLA